MKISTRRSLAITTILGVLSSFLLVIAPAQSASAAFRPVSDGGLSITSIANHQVMTDPVTGARNYMAGMPGDVLTILGSGFTAGPVTVTFLGNNAPSSSVDGTNLNVLTDTEMEITVPVGATTGLIHVSDTANAVNSLDAFQIWSARSESYVMPDGHLNITISDLKFILDQIKFSEAFARRTALPVTTTAATTVAYPYDTTQCMTAADFVSAKNLQLYGATGLSNAYIYDAVSPWGLRQVDGRCNNITVDANGNFIKRDWGATDTNFTRIEPQSPSANGLYTNAGGTVSDSTPRMISNLIADQTDANPAAVSAAEDTAATLGTSVTYSNSVNATTGVVSQALDIPNITSDYNSSAGYNSWFTLFGQFFDHGLDLIPKGDPAYVLIPLESTDPLYSTNPNNPNFMILTRGAQPAGTATGSVPAGESMNITTPYIDQSQSYGSHPSQNFFLREYSFAAGTGLPTDTGRLLDGTDGGYSLVSSPALNSTYPATDVASASLPSAWVTAGARNFTNSGTLGSTNGGLPTWRDIKAQSFLLGFRLTDYDAANIPVVATDQFGSFIPCATGGATNGFPMMLFKGATSNNYRWVCGNPTAPIATSFDEGGETWNSVNTNHNFINDTANNAVPSSSSGAKLKADADLIVNSAKAAAMVSGYYDNESLDAHYVAGDGRVNENIGLASVHGVFHGEHNLVLKDIQDLLMKNPQVSKEFFSEWNFAGGTTTNPNWNGIRLYQAARFVMEMEYQHMTFDEFIRRISPSLNLFVAYNQNVDPAITAEFASSVYRLGHSMLNETIARSVPGQYYSASANQDISLIDAFTSPIAFRTQKPITVLAAQRNATDQTITYTVQTSEGTVSPALNQIVTVAGFADSVLNVTNAVVSARTEGSFTVHSRYPGGAEASPVAFSGLTNDASVVLSIQASDGSSVATATINDPLGQFSYSPASATASVVQGMTAQRGNEIDEFVTDAVRSNLLGLPLDLAALNISRGRDTLLPTLNQFRTYLRDKNLAPVSPYISWMAFGNKMRHFDSLANFVAAYGTHPSVTTKRLGVITHVASTAASHSITYTTAAPVAGVISVGDIVSVSGLATTAFNINWASVSTIDGNTFTVDAAYATDPAAPKATTIGAFMAPAPGATALTGISDSAEATDAGYVTRRTTTDERRAAGQLLVPSDIKTAIMNDKAPSTITYSATNAFHVGDTVTIQGAVPLVFNQTGTVTDATSTTFTISVAPNLTVETHFMGGRAVASNRPADADAFINSQTSPAGATACDYPTGPTTCVNWATTESGMNYVDLWMGGLAEAPITQPISPEILPDTFDYVFTQQMLNLQNGDRFYYLSRLTGTNLGDEIAGQKFANIIMRNTPNSAGQLPAGAVATGSTAGLKATTNFIFGMGDCVVDGSTYTPANPGCPNTFLDATTNTITHTPLVLNTIMVNDENCIAGNRATHRIVGGGGDDIVWGGKCADILRGGIGGDTVAGLGGDDILFGEGGDDIIQGGPGNDVIDTGDNVVGDIADGGSGKDFVSAGAGKGVFAFSGETGDDFLVDGAQTPVPYNGGEGNDWIQDGLNGGPGAIMLGDTGPNAQLNNILDGGSDVIFSGGGNDFPDGGSGNDIFLAGDGIDFNTGAEGFDFVSYEYRNPVQNIFADLAGALAPQISVLPDAFLGIEGLSGSSANDLLSSDTAPDQTLTNVSGTVNSDIIYIPVNNTSIRAGQMISGPGIPSHTFVLGAPALVPNILTPTYQILLNNNLTANLVAANVQIHGWSLTSPEFVTGLTDLISKGPGWNKAITNVTLTGFTTTLGTATGNYFTLGNAIDWIPVGSTISVGGTTLVDGAGNAITVTGVNAESLALSAAPAVTPTFPATATVTPTNTFSGGNVVLGGAGDDIIYSQGGDNVIDGDAYLHTCISATLADGTTPFVTGADVPCGSSQGYSSLDLLNNFAGNGIVSPANMNIVREIKTPAGVAACGYTCNTLIYSGAQKQYTITPMVNPMGEVQYLVITKPDGVDIVRNVKTIQFGNPVIDPAASFSAMWSATCTAGVACITLASNYAPISNACLSVCPAPNVNSFAPPTVASIAPAGGGVGTVLTITGTNFRTVAGGTTVTIAGVAATNVNVVDTFTLTCVVPTGLAAGGAVVVTTLGGNGTSPTSFTLVPAPTITKLSVATGTSGTAVTVTGTNLTYLTKVDINGATAIIRTATATTIGITVPADASTGLVRVTTSSGSASFATPFVVKPTISSFTPVSGAIGNSVTITGTNFSAVTAVSFNGVKVAVPVAPATSPDIRIVSPTSIMVNVPVGATSGRVGVFTAASTTVAAATSTTNFTVLPKPTFNTVGLCATNSLTAAPAAGSCIQTGPVGTVVTAFGTNLTGASLVKFGNIVAPISLVAAGYVRFTIPTGVIFGTGQAVTITTPGGTVVSTTAGTVKTFTATNPAPTISTLTAVSGGDLATVRIIGTNLSGVTAVKFGSVAAANFKIISSTLILADAPTSATLATGTYTVSVTSTSPAATVTSNSFFTKTSATKVTPVAPTADKSSGSAGTAVTLTVPATSQMASLVSVKINGVSSPFTYTAGTIAAPFTATILTSVPASATGSGNITLVYPGSVSVTGPAFTITGAVLAPTVATFTPNQASVGATIVVNGTNLAGTTGVTFNSLPIAFKVLSATQISIVIPVGATTGTLTVVGTGGTVTSTATISIL